MTRNTTPRRTPTMTSTANELINKITGMEKPIKTRPKRPKQRGRGGLLLDCQRLRGMRGTSLSSLTTTTRQTVLKKDTSLAARMTRRTESPSHRRPIPRMAYSSATSSPPKLCTKVCFILPHVFNFSDSSLARLTDFLYVSDFYLAQPSTSLSISSLATPIPQYAIDEADSLLGPDLGFGHVGTWMPSKRNSGSSTMHMRSSSRGSSKGHEPETTVHVMDSKW